MKHANLNIIRFPEGEERKKGIEHVFEEIMAENFPSLKKETDIQVQENKMNTSRHRSRYIIVKMTNVKDKVRTLRAASEKKSQL